MIAIYSTYNHDIFLKHTDTIMYLPTHSGSDLIQVYRQVAARRIFSIAMAVGQVVARRIFPIAMVVNIP